MQKTANYGLNKPDQTDFYEIGDFNENMDIIDSKLKEVEDQEIPVATETQNGLMSSEMVTKLDGVATGANETIVVDNLETASATSALSAGQGKVLKEGLDQINTNLNAKVSATTTSINVVTKGATTAVERSFLQGSIHSTTKNPYIIFNHTLAGETMPNDTLQISFDGTNFYATGRKEGADAVTKKLDSDSKHGFVNYADGITVDCGFTPKVFMVISTNTSRIVTYYNSEIGFNCYAAAFSGSIACNSDYISEMKVTETGFVVKYTTKYKPENGTQFAWFAYK